MASLDSDFSCCIWMLIGVSPGTSIFTIALVLRQRLELSAAMSASFATLRACCAVALLSADRASLSVAFARSVANFALSQFS